MEITSENISSKKQLSISYSVEPKERISFNDWQKYIRSEREKMLNRNYAYIFSSA